VHQVNVTSDVKRPHHDIMFTAAPDVKEGTPLVQLFDGPSRATSRASRRSDGAQLSLDRAKQLLCGSSTAGDRRPGPVGVRPGQCRLARTQAVISQKLGTGPFDGELGVRKVECQYLTAGHRSSH